MKTIYVPALAAALALSTPAFAQGTTEPPARSTGLNQEQGKAAAPEKNSYNLLTINKLTKDLESAGFTDIRVISDSFVVQAKDKNGDPTVMTLSPSGVFAISEMTKKSQKEAKAGSGSTSQSSGQRQ